MSDAQLAKIFAANTIKSAKIFHYLHQKQYAKFFHACKTCQRMPNASCMHVEMQIYMHGNSAK